MGEETKRLFVGMKISRSLEADLASPAPGTERLFDGTDDDSLQIVNMGEEKFIGRYIEDGFPVPNLGDVARNVNKLITSITRGRRIDQDEIRVYSFEFHPSSRA